MQSVRAFCRLLWKESVDLVRPSGKIKREALNANLWRISWTVPIPLIGSPVTALFFYTKLDASVGLERQWRLGIIIAHSISTLCSVLIWVVAHKLSKGEPRQRALSGLVHGVVLFVLTLGLGVTTIDQLAVASISPFLVATITVGVLYYLPPSVAASIFTVFSILFYVTLSRFTDLSGQVLDTTLINGYMAIVLGFSLSVLNWRHFHVYQMQEQQIRQQQQILAEMAYQDPLTELPNRRSLDQMFQRELSFVTRNQSESCLIMFDLDDFKTINDNYGHPTGDRVLRQLAKFVTAQIRPGDTLVRLGGEEFIILAANTGLNDAAILAERVRNSIANHIFLIEGREIRLTASFGVAPILGTEAPQDYYTVVDRTLYEAKEKGKNSVAVWQRSSPNRKKRQAPVSALTDQKVR